MAIRFAILACAVASLTGSALPAEAGEPWHQGYGYWEATHEALYRLEHNIALLQADPAVDDGYKAPVDDPSRRQGQATPCGTSAGALALDVSVLLRPKANLHSVKLPHPLKPDGLRYPAKTYSAG